MSRSLEEIAEDLRRLAGTLGSDELAKIADEIDEVDAEQSEERVMEQGIHVPPRAK